jgi:H+/Na+-translocating ferredoxin:NAD+ oxidoreductase subunit B
MTPSLVDQIDELLPQTQCTQCGYNGCRPYAEAIASGTADINQCPPGGTQGVQQLAHLLKAEVKPLNPKHGQEQPRRVAVIIEQDCIGCTKCLPPCPVDAIVGANKLLHTVIEQECTGCELCIAPCPVNCIVMQEPTHPFIWDKTAANHARDRFRAKKRRLEKKEQAKAERLLKQKQMIARLKAQKKV